MAGMFGDRIEQDVDRRAVPRDRRIMVKLGVVVAAGAVQRQVIVPRGDIHMAGEDPDIVLGLGDGHRRQRIEAGGEAAGERGGICWVIRTGGLSGGRMVITSFSASTPPVDEPMATMMSVELKPGTGVSRFGTWPSGGRLRATTRAVAAIFTLAISRSEERRVGKERVSPCRSRWSPCTKKN